MSQAASVKPNGVSSATTPEVKRPLVLVVNASEEVPITVDERSQAEIDSFLLLEEEDEDRDTRRCRRAR